MAYTGWIAFSAVHVLPPDWTQPFQDQSMLDIFSASCLLVSWTLFAIQHKPWSLYLYVAFPIYFWREAVSRCAGSVDAVLRAKPAYLSRAMVGACLVVAALQSMVVSSSCAWTVLHKFS